MYQKAIRTGSEATPETLRKIGTETWPSVGKAFDPTHIEAGRLLGVARAIQNLRRTRASLFGGGIFSDPAWDVLLTLYIARLEQIRLKVSNLLEESGVPSTTGLRWLCALTEKGLVTRKANPMDARSSFVELTDVGALTMSSYIYEFRARMILVGNTIG